MDFVEMAQPVEATEGKVTLRWQLPEVETETVADVEYELVQSQDEAFTDPVTRYQGKDLGSVLTGLREGTYFYRVRAVDAEREGVWSEPLEVKVNYISMSWVWSLMAIGGIVFLATLGAVIGGHFKVARRAEGEEAKAHA